MASQVSAEHRNGKKMSSVMSIKVVQGPRLDNSEVHTWKIPVRAHPWWNAEQVPAPCTVCKEVPPCPRFLVAIKPPNPEEDFSLAVPGRFWKLHSSMLECDELQLKGPNEAIIKVKAKKTYREEEQKLNVRLESNWKSFLLANNLHVGDMLEFFLVANSCFTVYRLEKY